MIKDLLKRKGLGKKVATQSVLTVVTLGMSILWLMPFLWMLGTSMRREVDSFNLPPAFWPESWNIVNYEKVLTTIPFFKFMLNSIIMAGCATLFMVVFTTMAAYAISRIDFKFKNAVFVILISGMMIPTSSTLVPVFSTIRNMGLMDTRWAVILLGIYYPIGLLLLRSHMMTIPKSYDEAACIDGANRLQIFFKIILPMSRPTIAVATVLCFITNWNNFLVPLIFLSDKNKYPLPLGMQFLKSTWAIDQTVMLSAVIMSIIPLLIVYIFCQKYLLQGAITSGLKA